MEENIFKAKVGIKKSINIKTRAEVRTFVTITFVAIAFRSKKMDNA